MKEVGASKRLGHLIEGESLLNDGSAFVLFLVFRDILTGETQRNAGETVGYLFELVFLAAIIGVAFGFAATLFLALVYRCGLLLCVFSHSSLHRICRETGMPHRSVAPTQRCSVALFVEEPHSPCDGGPCTCMCVSLPQAHATMHPPPRHTAAPWARSRHIRVPSQIKARAAALRHSIDRACARMHIMRGTMALAPRRLCCPESMAVDPQPPRTCC
jgi:Sodium/hydrogen exchanger family